MLESTPVAAVPSPAAPLNVSSELVNSSQLVYVHRYVYRMKSILRRAACPSQRRRPPLPAIYLTRLRSRLPAAAFSQLSDTLAGRRFQTAIRLASGRACRPPLPASYPSSLRSRLPAAAFSQLSDSPPVAPAGRRFQAAIRLASGRACRPPLPARHPDLSSHARARVAPAETGIGRENLASQVHRPLEKR